MRLAISRLLLALVWSVGACGGPAAPTPPNATTAPVAIGQSPTPATAVAIDSCAILTDEEIQTATGQAVQERQPSTLTQVFNSVCDIELDGGLLSVSVLSPGGRAMYETSFEPFIGTTEMLDEAVSGLGDKAGRFGQSELMVLADDVLFDIHFLGAHPDKLPVVTYLAERILARLACISTGCPALPVPPAPTIGPATAAPTRPAVDPGGLPSTGAQTRLVNLYSESGQPVEVEVYAYAWSAAEATEVGALVATVPYGEASDWFNPGLVESPFGSEPYTKIDIYRVGDQGSPIAGTSEFLGPGTVTTIVVWQEELFEGQPEAWTQTIYAEHPDYQAPEAPADQGLLITRNGGLLAELEPPVLYAAVGNGCLESPIPRFDPQIPNAQPIGSDLVIPAGDHTLTVHEEPAGELPTCTTKALGPGAEVSVAPGDRLLAFPYRLPGETEVSLLVVPFDPS